MAIRVALQHVIRYKYDRPVTIAPHEARLRPAPHARTPVLSYTLSVQPEEHFVHWQQDPHGNYSARYLFPKEAKEVSFTVAMVVEMTGTAPFDYFVEQPADRWPFAYPDGMRAELVAYLHRGPLSPLFAKWMEDLKREGPKPGSGTMEFLQEVNRRVRASVRLLLEGETRLQGSEETLANGAGSSRDLAWLLVETLRHCGLAARFASGYLIHLAQDQRPVGEPKQPDKDGARLHAWAEVYLPGPGWVGLDPSSGEIAGEGHIPLGCSAVPGSASPILGGAHRAEAQGESELSIIRMHEDPRVTKPFSGEQWRRVQALGKKVDEDLVRDEVRLVQGERLTFVSADNRAAAEWNVGVFSEEKKRLAGVLGIRLKHALAPGGFYHVGQGMAHSGESDRRWIFGVYWREDGRPVWRDDRLVAIEGKDYGLSLADARRFVAALAEALGISPDETTAVEEDSRSVGYVLLLQAQGGQEEDPPSLVGRLVLTEWKAWARSAGSGPIRIVAGDSPMGLRLPVQGAASEVSALDSPEGARTMLGAEVRAGKLCVFFPRLERLGDYLSLVSAVEAAAAQTLIPVRLEGAPPPLSLRLRVIQIVPAPGVLEVLLPASSSWGDLVELTHALYDEARQAGLSPEKFLLDGRHTGTGGGGALTLGGITWADSPLLRRPDLLRSLVAYTQNHPSLSYLFAGAFVGPDGPAPRGDEISARHAYELQIAFRELERVVPSLAADQLPWVVDRMFRPLFTDACGDPQRSEFCFASLSSPHGEEGRQGSLELRALEMTPHPQMSLLQWLLIRALVARFWKEPFREALVSWGPRLHDQFMLPHFLMQDLQQVLKELQSAGYSFQQEWFAPFFNFRFPACGSVVHHGMELELRQALEPWRALGGGTRSDSPLRSVDASVERLQVTVRGMTGGRYALACNGRLVPLQPTGVHGEFVAGVRYRAWSPPLALHPTVGVHAPLTFDLLDRWSDLALGGCTYHVSHPGGRSESAFPANASEAEARRRARFWDHGHAPGPMKVPSPETNPLYAMTLDLLLGADFRTE
jgi:uncharacterized protein (DUF2126 family)